MFYGFVVVSKVYSRFSYVFWFKVLFTFLRPPYVYVFKVDISLCFMVYIFFWIFLDKIYIGKVICIDLPSSSVLLVK